MDFGRIRPATDADIEAITDIYNHAIVNSTAAWDDEPKSLIDRKTWLSGVRAKGYPAIVAVDADDTVLGYAAYNDFRHWNGYRKTVEHTIYLCEGVRGQGIGEALMTELIEHAEAGGKHAMIGAITADNTGSIKLHEKLGFVRVGYLPEVGEKFDTWLDLALYQLTLPREA